MKAITSGLIKKTGTVKVPMTLKDILQKCGFEFYSYSGPKVKLPCIIAANIVSPRIDYHERAKTRIDTHPFSSAIIAGVLKISEEIRTFRASGYEFYTEREMREFSKARREKMTGTSHSRRGASGTQEGGRTLT